MLRYTIILFCLLPIPSRANLGETIQQCVARYGRPGNFTEANAKIPFGTLTFVAGRYALILFLLQYKGGGAPGTKGGQTSLSLPPEAGDLAAVYHAGSQH